MTVLPVEQELERNLQDIHIPPCPEILVRIMDEMQKDEPDYPLLSRLISNDVALAAGLIKTANSPYFFRQQKVRSVQESLTLLGLRTTSHAIAGLILRDQFPASPHMIRFWDASARTARISAWLADQLDMRGLQIDDAFTFGLFHDCGIPILMAHFSNYREVLDRANQEANGSFTDTETALIQTNHALAGALLARTWGLPEDMHAGIQHHHNLSMLAADAPLPRTSRLLIATILFAEHIAQRQLGLAVTHEWSKLGDACLQVLQVDEEDLDRLYAEAQPIVLETVN